MTSGKKLDRETVDYLRTLPEIVRRVQGGRIYYTNSFRTQATARYAMGDRPVDIFRDNGIGPEVIGYKRIERCLARWRESQDEILNSGNAKAGVENKLGGEASDSELFRSGAAGAPNIPESARAARAWRDSAESSLPAGTGSESDFHVSPERRAIIFPVSRKEQNNDLRDLLISQQVRRIDELERQVDMLEALLHGRRRKEQAANTLPEEQTDTAADKSPDTDGQQQ